MIVWFRPLDTPAVKNAASVLDPARSYKAFTYNCVDFDSA